MSEGKKLYKRCWSCKGWGSKCAECDGGGRTWWNEYCTSCRGAETIVDVAKKKLCNLCAGKGRMWLGTYKRPPGSPTDYDLFMRAIGRSEK